MNHLINNKKIRYVLVGGFNTAFGYIVFYSNYIVLSKYINYILIVLLSHLISAIVAFILYRHFVFKNHNPIIPSFLKFNLSLTSQLILNLGITIFLVELAHIRVEISQFISVILSAIFGYFAHNHFSFRKKNE